jgi:two-component system phosphate regulon sensor histidine kinase PhoR
MAERAEMKNIEYELLMSQQPLVVMIRPNAVEQIVENLLDNAIKYTPEEGEISVRLSSQGGWVLIEVSDTGMGIREEDMERVFERFYRTREARDPRLEGTGLGLSIVKSLVEYYEGTITVSSYPGKGSIFCVSLPLKPHK